MLAKMRRNMRRGTLLLTVDDLSCFAARRREVCGLRYVNSLIEQDTATAVDPGGVLPTSDFPQYSLDASFDSGGTVLGGAGSYDSLAIQPSNNMRRNMRRGTLLLTLANIPGRQR
jgi:hypothetical protein